MAARRRDAASPRRAAKRLEVWKFGGAALADADAVRNVVELIQAHRGPLVVVVSALSGVMRWLTSRMVLRTTSSTSRAESA